MIGPFFVVHVEHLSGGMEKLGIAFGIMILVQSLTTYVVGRFSDRLGRKPFLFFTAYADAVILYLYTLIESTSQVYILQGCFGFTNGISGTMTTSLLGDLTVKGRRGRAIGQYSAIVSLCSAFGIALGGYMVKAYGMHTLLYTAAVVVALSTGLLIPLDENPTDP